MRRDDYPDFTRTKAAFVVYDERMKVLNTRLPVMRTNKQFEAWEAEVERVSAKVRRAFFDDTSDRNGWTSLQYAPVESLRELMNKCEASKELLGREEN